MIDVITEQLQSQCSCQLEPNSTNFFSPPACGHYVWLCMTEEVRTSALLIRGARAFFFSPPLSLWTRDSWGCSTNVGLRLQNLTRRSEPEKSLGVHHLCAWPAKCHVIIVAIRQGCISLRVNLCVPPVMEHSFVRLVYVRDCTLGLVKLFFINPQEGVRPLLFDPS